MTIPAGVTVAVAYSREHGKHNTRSKKEWIIEDLSREGDENGLILLRGIKNSHDRKTVFLHNCSDRPLLVQKGRILGSITAAPSLFAPILEVSDCQDKEEPRTGVTGIKWANDNTNTPIMNQSGGWEGKPSHEFILYDSDAKSQHETIFREFIFREGTDIFEESISGVSKLTPMPIDLINENENVVWRPGAKVPYKWRPFVEEKLIALGKIR